MVELPAVLTVEEVAAVLRVSKMTVYRLLHAGTIPSIRVNRSFRVSREAFESYVRGATTGGGSGGVP